MSGDLLDIARRLDAAMLAVKALPQTQVPLTVAQAYEIQSASLARRYARGEKRIGVKMGFTSRAKMQQMGLDKMIWGRLTDAMLLEAGGTVSRSRFIHPRVEPEIAFMLKRPLSGTIDAMTAAAAVEAVAPALELIDSRYENFKFSLTDVIADNSSSSAFVIGPWASRDTDLSNLGLVMEIDGMTRQVGSTAAILSNPLFSLVAAARLVAEAGEKLSKGDIVMAGGATAAEAVNVGDFISLEIQHLGRVQIMMGP